MKAFIAYRFTGEDPKELKPLLTAACEAFKTRDIDAYCTLFDEQKFRDKGYTRLQILQHAFEVIDASDLLFVLQTSNEKSEGMLVEVGYSLANNVPIVAAPKLHIGNSLISEVALKTLYWENLSDLIGKIKSFEFAALHSLN